MFFFYPWADFSLQVFLYFTILLGFIYIVSKHYRSSFSLLIILLFFPGLFSFLGKNIFDVYQIITLSVAVFIALSNNVFRNLTRKDLLVIIVFISFSGVFFYSSFINGDTWTIKLAQFSRYLIMVLLWFILKSEFKKGQPFNNLLNLVFTLFILQVIFSIIKLLLFGRSIESLVGSMSHIGGAIGSIIPLMGFIFIWLWRKGKMEKNDWLFILGLMFVGYMAGKRAIFFIMPVTIAIFIFWIPRQRLSRTHILSILILPIIIYLGFRLTPTLNPENVVWGRFDFSYALDYARVYQFGRDDRRDMFVAQGRGDGTIWLWNNLWSNENLTRKDWFGSGLRGFYGEDVDFYELGYGIVYKGGASGVYQSYVTLGYSGAIATILLFFTMVFSIKSRRLKIAIALITAWEYFMYTGILFRQPVFTFMLVFFIHYANYFYLKGRFNIKEKIPNDIPLFYMK